MGSPVTLRLEFEESNEADLDELDEKTMFPAKKSNIYHLTLVIQFACYHAKNKYPPLVINAGPLLADRLHQQNSRIRQIHPVVGIHPLLALEFWYDSNGISPFGSGRVKFR